MCKKGVYKIKCIITDRVYIGSSATSLKRRFAKHRQRLKANTHENSYLQSAWNELGEQNFLFEIIEELIDTDIIRQREQHWLNIFFPMGRDFCFNLTDNVGGGNTLNDPDVKIRHAQGVKNSYTEDLRSTRRKQLAGRYKEFKEKGIQACDTEEHRTKHAVRMRELAKNPEWLTKTRANNVARGKKVGTDKGEIFSSVSEAARQTGSRNSNIRACINGKISTSMGRKWFFINNDNVKPE